MLLQRHACDLVGEQLLLLLESDRLLFEPNADGHLAVTAQEDDTPTTDETQTDAQEYAVMASLHNVKDVLLSAR